jgi:hypothetical protein
VSERDGGVPGLELAVFGSMWWEVEEGIASEGGGGKREGGRGRDKSL